MLIIIGICSMVLFQADLYADNSAPAASQGNQGYIAGTAPAATTSPAPAATDASQVQPASEDHPFVNLIEWAKKENQWQEDHIW